LIYRQEKFNMRIRKTYYQPVLVALAVALAGCAAIQKNETDQTEQTLAAAGFQMQPADSPARMAHLQTLTQHKLVPHDKDGEMFYVYADASDCKCIYTGDEAAYQAYQKMAVDERIADDQRMAAEMNEDDMDWGLWGGGFRR
jgi:hypothetical protein